MKKIISVILAVLLIAALGTGAFAADDLEVVYSTSGALTDNYAESNFLQPVADLQPGDSVTLTVHLYNQNASGSNWYMSNEVLKSLEDADAAGSAYGYLLTFKGPNESGTIYDSETVGGDDSEGLFEATEGLKDLFFLDTLKTGETATVELTVSLDGETEGNAYFDTLARLQMNFAVEPVEESTTPTPTPTPGTPGKVVKTGDDTDLFPYYAAMAVSGLLFLALAIDSIRRRRKEQEDV